MEKQSVLEVLRQKAEQLLSANDEKLDELETIKVKRIFHEVQVYQLELEMQNDELQLTATELEQQKTKFTNLFELAPIGYFVTDKTGIILDVNRAGLQMFGLTKEAITKRPLLLHVYRDDNDIFYNYFNRLFLNPVAQSCQIRLINAQKQLLTVNIEGIALMNTAADPVCYLTVTDITKQQSAEQKLKEAKKTLEIALDASLTGIWDMDILSGQVYLDRFCCSLYSFEPDAHNQKYENLMKCIHPNDRKNVEEHIRKTIIQENEFNVRFRTASPGETYKYIQARAQIIKDQQDKKCLIGTFTDISEKTITELQAGKIKDEQQQMILAAGLQAEENEKKRISEVLHDGIAQMLYAIKLDVDQIKHTADGMMISKINDLLRQSIKDIRNISFELAPAILTDFGLADTLEDLAIRLSNPKLHMSTKVTNIHKNLDFQLQLNIFRIIQELINNSIKHANAGKIIIEVTKKYKHILIKVTDNGIGFETDDQLKIPKGIGLSSIKNRLRLYKGTLKIESQLNAGTTVYINLNIKKA